MKIKTKSIHGLTPADYKKMKQDLIKYDMNVLGFDKKTAIKWTNITIKIIKEVVKN